MKTTTKIYSTNYEIKKSKFIAFCIPFCELQSTLNKLRIEHPKASHIVSAYRSINQFHQIVEASNDDGEPKGTSGPPILNVLRGFDAINISILIVRYFGGIKLGTGGLVKAYGTSAKLVLEKTELQTYEHKYKYKFDTTYAFHKQIDHYLKNNSIQFQRNFQANDIQYKLLLTKSQKDQLKKFLGKFLIKIKDN